jgi:hypothetical protein
MLELLVLLSIITLATSRFWNKYYISYIIKFVQVLVYSFVPMVLTENVISSSLGLNTKFSVVSAFLITIVALEAEHFNIKRWIKESIFLLFIVLTLTTSLAVSFGSVVLISMLLMVSKRNRFIDFIHFSVVLLGFCLYFSELYGTYNNSIDSYVVYYNEYSSILFPLLILGTFICTLISTWGFSRSTSVTPLLTSVLLMIKFKSGLSGLHNYLYVCLAIFLLYSLNNYKKFLIRKNLSSAINVLFGLACYPVLQNVMNGNFEQALVHSMILSIILYTIRLYNVDKFRNLLDFKTITIFYTLFNLSYFPFGITGLEVMNSLALSFISLELLFLVPLVFISWSILYFSIKDFTSSITFNFWEAKVSVKIYCGFLIISTFLLMYINLPILFIGENYSRLLLRDIFSNCCDSVSRDRYSFNVSLLLTIIFFTLYVYGLKIFNFEKLWKTKMRFISMFRSNQTFKIPQAVKEKGVRRSNITAFDKIGQSSSFGVGFFILILFVSILLVIMEKG